MQITHSIVIPAYNEARRLAATLSDVALHCERAVAQGARQEVIVVCDGCTDETERIARSFQGRAPLRVIAYRVNRGKGYAVRRGVLASRGDIVLFMDADGSAPVGELDRLASPIRAGTAEVVVGSRRAAGARVEVRQTAMRRLLGALFSWHTRALLGLGIRDTQCGFKVFEGSAARELFGHLKCDRFAFDLELLVLAREQGLRLAELGVTWREVAGSTVNPVRDGLHMLATAWRLRLSRGARRSSALRASRVQRRLAPAVGGHVR